MTSKVFKKCVEKLKNGHTIWSIKFYENSKHNSINMYAGEINNVAINGELLYYSYNTVSIHPATKKHVYSSGQNVVHRKHILSMVIVSDEKAIKSFSRASSLTTLTYNNVK